MPCIEKLQVDITCECLDHVLSLIVDLVYFAENNRPKCYEDTKWLAWGGRIPDLRMIHSSYNSYNHSTNFSAALVSAPAMASDVRPAKRLRMTEGMQRIFSAAFQLVKDLCTSLFKLHISEFDHCHIYDLSIIVASTGD